MSFDYLEDLESSVESGAFIYACPGSSSNKWHISKKVKELVPQAQRVADGRGMKVHIYQLIARMDAITGDSFLICRKIHQPGPSGEPRLEWALVDTREAAETMRDVSEGPSPYFGATLFKTLEPSAEDGAGEV